MTVISMKEKQENGVGLDMVMKLADITIKNDGTEDDFRLSIIHSLQTIGVE